MANQHGKDSAFLLEDSAATTLRNISPYLNSVEFSQENELADTTCLGAEGRTFKQGLTNGTISLAGLWDNTATVGATTVIQGLVGLEVSTGFEWGPMGNTSTNYKLSGECLLESYTESAPVGDMVSFTATLRISGSVTVGAFS